jgi:hypothetical protein
MTSTTTASQTDIGARVTTPQEIIRICDRIEAGYAAERSALDDEMLPHVIDLADRTSEIRAMSTAVQSLTVQLEAALAALEAASADATKVRETLAAVVPFAHSRAEDLHEAGGDESDAWKKADAAVSAAYALLAS